MADDKKKEKKLDPFHDEYLDKKVSDLYDDWKKLHQRDVQTEISTDVTNSADFYSDIAKQYLGEVFGTDASKKPKKHTFEYAKDQLAARKNAQKLISKLALSHMERTHGKAYADAHHKNQDQIENYMLGLGIRYDDMVKEFAESKNIVNDEKIKRYMSALGQHENKQIKKINRIQKHLSEDLHHEDLQNLINSEIQDYGFHFRKNIRAKDMFENMADYYSQGALTPSTFEDYAHRFKKYKKKDEK